MNDIETQRNRQARPSEGKGHWFESSWVRQFSPLNICFKIVIPGAAVIFEFGYHPDTTIF